jgi:hypothetical protein
MKILLKIVMSNKDGIVQGQGVRLPTQIYDLECALLETLTNYIMYESNKKHNYLLLLPFVLGPLVCFPSELIWNYVSYRQMVGLLGWVISPVARPLPT